jgi:hypothetical protein
VVDLPNYSQEAQLPNYSHKKAAVLEEVAHQQPAAAAIIGRAAWGGTFIAAAGEAVGAGYELIWVIQHLLDIPTIEIYIALDFPECSGHSPH